LFSVVKPVIFQAPFFVLVLLKAYSLTRNLANLKSRQALFYP